MRTLGRYIATMLPVTLSSPLNDIFLAKKVISVVPQAPYSPDLSPCDSFLFPKLKFHLKGRYFGTMDDIQKVVTDQLRALLHEDVQHCYWEWEQRLRRCVASQGNYFKGDNVELWVNVKKKYSASLITILTHHIVLETCRGIRGLLEKYPTFGREKETGLLGALDT